MGWIITCFNVGIFSSPDTSAVLLYYNMAFFRAFLTYSDSKVSSFRVLEFFMFLNMFLSVYTSSLEDTLSIFFSFYLNFLKCYFVVSIAHFTCAFVAVCGGSDVFSSVDIFISTSCSKNDSPV